VSETGVILPGILLALQSRWPDALVVRRNVGKALAKDKKTGKTRMVSFGMTGMADIHCIVCGRAIEIEVKRPSKTLRTSQSNWKKAVERAGGWHILATSPEQAVYEVEKLIENLKRG
jgi:hypothetical protein